jgi:bacterioferritin-associated ferredoxin
MVICHCHGITDREIRRAVRSGAGSRRDVARTCKAGGSCGGCVRVIDQILASEASSRAVEPLAACEPLAAGTG